MNPVHKNLYRQLLDSTLMKWSIWPPHYNEYARETFDQFEKLLPSIANGALHNSDVRAAILAIKDKMDISYGQAQKGLNVFLKYHCYQFHPENLALLAELDCPVDSKNKKRLCIAWTSLRATDEQEYLRIQDLVEKSTNGRPRVEYDSEIDRQDLRKYGLDS